MSMFRTVTLNCPECGTHVEFNAVISVNADRRPDLRAAIIDGSFQRQPCPKCGKSFRLDPEMTYIDVRQGQWIAAYPVAKLGHWKELEEQARTSFAQAYGPQAPAAARQLGAGMKPRITFGWGGLREKLIVVDHHLDDVTLELAKLAILRASKTSPLSNETEMRFLDVDADKLVMAWIRAQTEQVVEGLKVPRQLYDDIAANEEGWRSLREELSAGLFVDMNRLMVISA
jgi:endogenous inhibitor of DNA gyrase (YacG/DUF329 family)